MRIIKNYILRESIIPFFIALGILTSVFLLGYLIDLTDLVVNKGVSLKTIGKIFLFYIPVLFGYTLPIACLVSVILTFSQFSTNNEIIAIRASGIHLGRLLKPLLVIGVIISLFCVILNERIIPYAHHEQRKILTNLGTDNPEAFLEAGVFLDAFKGYSLFIQKIEDNRFFNISIFEPQPDGTVRTIIANRGEFTPIPDKNEIKIKLINGTADEPNLQDPTKFFKVNFDTYFMTLDLSTKNEKIEKKPKSMTLRELKTEIARARDHDIEETAKLETEYYRKITWSLSPFIFILLGFPLAVITNRREKSANVVVAIICAAFYYLLSLGCQGLAIENTISPAIIMWAPNTIALIAAIYLNYKCVS